MNDKANPDLFKQRSNGIATSKAQGNSEHADFLAAHHASRGLDEQLAAMARTVTLYKKIIRLADVHRLATGFDQLAQNRIGVALADYGTKELKARFKSWQTVWQNMIRGAKSYSRSTNERGLYVMERAPRLLLELHAIGKALREMLPGDCYYDDEPVQKALGLLYSSPALKG